MAHAARELVGEELAPALELHRVELLFRHGSPLLLAHAAKLEAEGNVVEHGAMRQQTHVLEDHADFLGTDLAKLFRAHAGDVLAMDPDLAIGGLDETIDVAHQGGLATAR